ncbi:Adenylate cyclase type 10, partial [Entophlyctis luteolus]
YSKLTSHLKNHYGDDGGAKVKELLNPPIIEIIRRVRQANGSIIKFAGDAIIASWEIKPGLNPPDTELIILNALLCCLDLLSYFLEYNIMIPATVEAAKSSNQSDSDSKSATPTQGPKRFSMAPSVSTKRLSSTPMSYAPSMSRNRQPSTASASASNSRGSNSFASSMIAQRRPSGDLSLDFASTVCKPQALKIHIGLGFGMTSHVHVGGKTGDAERIEYFVAGESMKLAAEYLAIGKEGDLVFSSELMQHLCPQVQEEIAKFAELKKSQGLKYRIISSASSDDAFDLQKPLLFKIAELIKQQNSMSMRSPSAPSVKLPNMSKATIFVDDSIRRLIDAHSVPIKPPDSPSKFNTTSARNTVGSAMHLLGHLSNCPIPIIEQIGPDGDQTNEGGLSIRNSSVNLVRAISNVFSQSNRNLVQEEAKEPEILNLSKMLENYDQLRSVTVMFLKMAEFSPESVHLPENVNLLQKATMIILSTIAKYEGCLRQLNCDDKGVTALLVWGLDGFSHEKGEQSLVVSAALHMIPLFGELFGSKFSIGIATGSAFSGIVGNGQRCDGTVLGVCVNNAARLMCLPQSEGTAICDEETYVACKDAFEFNEGMGSVAIKGVPLPVSIFAPSKKATPKTKKNTIDDSVLVGRDSEKSIILNSVVNWLEGEVESIFIAGRSGVGKTALRGYCEKRIIQDRSVIICSGQSFEHQQKSSLFIFGEIMRELSYHIKSRVDMKQISPFASKRSSKFSANTRNSMKNSETNEKRRSVAMSILDGDGKRSSLFPPRDGQLFMSKESQVGRVTESYKDSNQSKHSSSSVQMKPLNSDNSIADKGKGTSHSKKSVANAQSSGGNLEESQFGQFGSLNRKSLNLEQSLVLQYLNHLGEPPSSIELMKYIPGVFESSESSVQLAIDILPRLSGIISKILESLTAAGFKLALILDDLQEWPQVDHFEVLRTLSKHTIDLAPFGFEEIEQLIRFKFRLKLTSADTISQKLVQDILERSQGLALVANILLNILQEENLVEVQENELDYSVSCSIDLPKEAVGVVVSQFDKLAGPIKVILRLAAVSGQHFNLNNNAERKHEIVSAAFAEAAMTCSAFRAKEYYDILQNIRQESSIKLNELELANECKLLGQVHFELGDRTQSVRFYFESLKHLGFIFPQNLLLQYAQAAAYLFEMKKFIKKTSEEQMRFSVSFLERKFPRLSKNLPSVGLYSAFEGVDFTIGGILRILSSHKKSIASFALFSGLAGCLMGWNQDDWILRYCLIYSLLSDAAKQAGFPNFSDELAALSDDLYIKVMETYKVENMTSMQVLTFSELLWQKGEAFRIQGKWLQALECFREFEDIKTDIGLGASVDAFSARQKVSEIMIMLGEFSGVEYDWEHLAKWFDENVCDSFVHASFLVQQAVVDCYLGNFELSNQAYTENASVERPGWTGERNVGNHTIENVITFEKDELKRIASKF